MAKNNEIKIVPFNFFTHDMFPQYTRDQFRQTVRKSVPAVAVNGKFYIRKAPYSNLVYRLADAMTEMSTQSLRDKLEDLNKKYSGINLEKLPKSFNAKQKMEVLCAILIPVELERRNQILENLNNN
ncbi:MAG: hypothetical protein ACI4S0_00320 [Dorea sp.]